MSDCKPMDLFDEFPPQPEEPAPESAAPQPEEVRTPDAPAEAEPEQTPAPEEHFQAEPAPQPEEPDQAEALPAPQPPEGDPQSGMVLEALNRMAETAGQISGRMEALSELFQKRIMYAAHEEKIVDQMHKELQRYKEGLYAQLVRPILMDIIEVRDSIIRVGSAYRAKPEGEQAVPNKTFSDYAYDLQDILEKNNVEIYQSQPGDAFVPARQRAIKKTPTADESLHGKVAESLSSGYSCDGRILSAEKVCVYTYEKPAENKEVSEVSEHG